MAQAPTNDRMEPINVRMPDILVAAGEAAAASEARKFSDVVRRALDEVWKRGGYLCSTCSLLTPRAANLLDGDVPTGGLCINPKHRSRKETNAEVPA